MNYTTTYKKVKEGHPFSLRGLAREIAISSLAIGTNFYDNKKLEQKPRVQFLLLHHVFDDELSKFDQLLRNLSKKYTFISYSEAVKKILRNEVDKPYLSFSSDDGFKNNLKASEILDRFNIKACFFVNPDSIGLSHPEEIKRFCRSRLNFPPTEFLTWEDVDYIQKNGHEIGSHTMGHINVVETNLTDLKVNLKRSYEELNAKCGRVDHFAYPYGRFFHFNVAAFDAVFEVGYTSCASAERGCHVTDKVINPSELFIRRDHLICDWHPTHIEYFLLRNSRNSNVKNNFLPY